MSCSQFLEKHKDIRSFQCLTVLIVHKLFICSYGISCYFNLCLLAPSSLISPFKHLCTLKRAHLSLFFSRLMHLFQAPEHEVLGDSMKSRINTALLSSTSQSSQQMTAHFSNINAHIPTHFSNYNYFMTI